MNFFVALTFYLWKVKYGLGRFSHICQREISLGHLIQKNKRAELFKALGSKLQDIIIKAHIYLVFAMLAVLAL